MTDLQAIINKETQDWTNEEIVALISGLRAQRTNFNVAKAQGKKAPAGENVSLDDLMGDIQL